MPKIVKYQNKYKDKIVDLILQGKTMQEVADALPDVPLGMLYYWIDKQPELSDEIKKVRTFRLIEATYRKACGYEYVEKRARQIKLGGKERTVITEVITKQQPPDASAAQFLLKNWNPEMFKDKMELAHSGGMTLLIDPAAIRDDPPMMIECE